MQISKYIPNELFHIIFNYDGRIKYKNGKFVNGIHQKDERYDIIRPIIIRKIEIMKTIEWSHSGFYFDIGLNQFHRIGLVYDCNFSYPNKFEICYYRESTIQIRTYV
jgi:hypothetical protein